MPVRLYHTYDEITTKSFVPSGCTVSAMLNGGKLQRVTICMLEKPMTATVKFHDNGNFKSCCKAYNTGDIADYFDQNSNPTHTIMNTLIGCHIFCYQDDDHCRAGEIVGYLKDKDGRLLPCGRYPMNATVKLHELRARITPVMDLLRELKL